MQSETPLAAAALATAQLAAGCNLSGADLTVAIAAFREISASSPPAPALITKPVVKPKRGRPRLESAVFAPPPDRAPPAPPKKRKPGRPKPVRTAAATLPAASIPARVRPSIAKQAKPAKAVGRGSSTSWSWQDVHGVAPAPSGRPEPPPPITGQEAMLRRLAGILQKTPVRLSDSASVSLSRATGKAIGRDLVRDLAQFADGRLQVTFGFAHGSAVYVAEIDPGSALGEAAIEQLAQCAATALEGAAWLTLDRNLPKLRIASSAA